MPPSTRLDGGPQSVASDVADFAVSPSGTIVIAPRDNASLRMAWLDSQGSVGPPVAEPGLYTGVTTPHLSPDGTRMIFMRPAANGRPHVWQVDLRRNVSTRITTTPEPENAAVYPSDGQQVVFSRALATSTAARPMASGSDELLFASPIRKTPTDISPDGSVLVFTQSGSATGPDIWVLPLTGERTPRPLVVTSAFEGYAQFSPDGRWIAVPPGFSRRLGPGIRRALPTDRGVNAPVGDARVFTEMERQRARDLLRHADRPDHARLAGRWQAARSTPASPSP